MSAKSGQTRHTQGNWEIYEPYSVGGKFSSAFMDGRGYWIQVPPTAPWKLIDGSPGFGVCVTAVQGATSIPASEQAAAIIPNLTGHLNCDRAPTVWEK